MYADTNVDFNGLTNVVCRTTWKMVEEASMYTFLTRESERAMRSSAGVKVGFVKPIKDTTTMSLLQDSPLRYGILMKCLSQSTKSCCRLTIPDMEVLYSKDSYETNPSLRITRLREL